MPRRKRVYLPGFPYHLVQRGNNRQPCFSERTDFENYLDLWREKSHRYGVQVHAYCLMTNHIHFVVSSDETDAISNTMKVVGSRYAFHFNKRYQRSGTLWEGRHRSSLIDSERYLLTCLRYVELNPVRAGMAVLPDNYEWSSYALNTAPRHSWLTPHSVYLALGRDAVERARVNRGFFHPLIAKNEIDLIRQAAHYSVPVGDERFRRGIESKFSLQPSYTTHGRPTKNSNTETD
jgi:putative transposase